MNKKYIQRDGLQIVTVKLQITDLLNNHFLDLMAVLLILLSTLFDWLISTSQSLLHGALWLDRLLLALVTDFSGLLLAIFGVAVLLSFLGASLHLEFADFLRLEMTVLFFHRKWEDIREFLTIPMHIGLTYFDLNLSRDVIAILLGFPCADNLLLSVSIRLRGLLAPTVELDSVGAGDIIYDLLLHVAIRRLDITALIVILRGGVYLVCGVTDAILTREASLNLVRFLKSFVVNGFHKIANQFINIEANALDVGFNDASAIFKELRLTNLLVLGPASLLLVWLAPILKHNLFNLMTVGILVYSITSNIGLSNIRIVFLSGRRCRVLLRNCWRSTKNT